MTTRPKTDCEAFGARPSADKEALRLEKEAFEKVKAALCAKFDIPAANFDAIASVSAIRRKSILSKEEIFEVNADLELPGTEAADSPQLEEEISSVISSLGSCNLKIIPSVKIRPLGFPGPVSPMARRSSPLERFSIPTLVVASGKGGVGKSTVAVNLAAAFSAMGRKAGLIDADVYGYSVPAMLGISKTPRQIDSMLVPETAWGIKAISIGMFAQGNKPVLWRGPRLSRAFVQFVNRTLWGDLDILIIDLPPGTGDMTISCAQMIPSACCLVVTTPQISSALIAARSGLAFGKFNEKIIGVVENMSFAGEGEAKSFPFGRGGGLKAAEILTEASGRPVPLLAQIPLSSDVSGLCEEGRPAALNPDGSPSSSPFGKLFSSLAGEVESLMKGAVAAK